MKSFKQFMAETNMSRAEAHGIFASLGVDSRGKSIPELKKHYMGLIRKHHPDNGGDVGTAQKINSAWDTLKTPGRDEAPRARPGGTHSARYAASSRRPEPVGTPEWAWAGYSGGMPPSHNIYQNNHRDMNFVKKDIWEKSGKSKKEYTISQFDGRYFRGMLTVYGNEKIYPHMADAMNTWRNDFKSKAIFVHKNKDYDTHHLIWANGQHVPPGHTIKGRKNDHNFTENLSAWIDERVPPK